MYTVHTCTVQYRVVMKQQVRHRLENSDGIFQAGNLIPAKDLHLHTYINPAWQVKPKIRVSGLLRHRSYLLYSTALEKVSPLTKLSSLRCTATAARTA